MSTVDLCWLAVKAVALATAAAFTISLIIYVALNLIDAEPIDLEDPS